MQIKTQFTFDKVRFDRDNHIHLVATLKAPKLIPSSKRPAVCITVACDVSGSMNGSKLDYAKKTMVKLIEHLQPGDSFGLVTFDTGVEVVIPTQEITQYKKEDFKAKIGRLEPGSSTNLSGGMLEALALSNKMDLPEGAINRVILLTDGQPNAGVARTPAELAATLSANKGKATVSMFGYGADTNHELLADLAKIGKGNFAFIKNPDDAVTAFAKELGGLLSTYAQNIQLKIESQNGHEIREVVSDVDAEIESGNATITIPELLSEEERHIVLDVQLSQQKKALPRSTTAFLLKASYFVLDENGKKEEKTEELKAQIQLVKAGEEQDKPTPEVDKLVGLAQLVQAQVKAENAAAKGEFLAANVIIQEQVDSFSSRGLDALEGAAVNMKGLVGNRAGYVGSVGLRSAVRNSGTRSYSTSSSNTDAQAFYSGVGLSFSNSAQAAVADSFQAAAGEGGNSMVAPSPVIPLGGSVVIGGAVALGTPAPAPEEVKEEKKNEKASKKGSKKRSSRW